ncbi:hypothetical protein L1049_014224 [Liquidambar formosana]|uniref:Sulfotransferase n=1 Tax=Liquidambar formosana TaxID=63359 RepID=A0AAP0RQ43_LIQFO
MRWMDSALKFTVLLMLLGLVSTVTSGSPTKDGFSHCERTVKKWASSSLAVDIKEDKHTLRDMLFFLHVPRTGGRTYFHCFLKKLYSSTLECPRSYDKLRFDPSKTNCRLLVTHDDYSMMTKLPQEKTSVVTILRNPVDRVFSTYEFSVEVAARFLVHPNLTSATRMTGRLRSKTNGISTLDIWPWKYLVPWMREDLFARREARKSKGQNYVKSNDSYNMEDVVMPLHVYINDPVAKDIIHNGATFQVAGLTNNSYLSESHEVRHCVQNYRTLGEYVLEVAKKRLDNMLYVGLTEDHKESATMFANVVGAQVISQLIESSSRIESLANNKSEQSSFFPHSEPDNNHNLNSSTDQKASEFASTEDVDATNEIMTVGKLMDAYEVCISSLRKTQAHRRTASLKRISPANFTKEARQSGS